jgi:hypothetical protein
MHDALKKEAEKMRERERLTASARAAAMSALLKLVHRRHDPLTYETQADTDENQNGDYR